MMNRYTRWSVLACGVLASAALVAVPVVPAAAAPQGVRGVAAVHVDGASMINRLTALHANTYMFLVRATGDQRDWDDLRLDFAPKAQTAGIRIWVYLLPPNSCGDPECDDYLPFKDDYVAWRAASRGCRCSTRW